MDPAEEQDHVGEIHPLVSVRVGVVLAWCLLGELHCCVMQGELTRVLDVVWRERGDLYLPPELGLSSNERSFCNATISHRSRQRHQIRSGRVALYAN